MRRSTRLDHERRIEEAVTFLVEHLDEVIDLRMVADRVCLSRFHFHRVFQALMGETAGDLIRRLRLERAARDLHQTNRAITEVAFEAGYATHEAFIRAFRAAFGPAPSEFRRRKCLIGQLPTPNGLHFVDPAFHFVAPQGTLTMNVEIRTSPGFRAICMPHQGAYYLIGQTFGQLFGFLGEKAIATREAIAFYYDDPAITPLEELKSDAGAILIDDYSGADPRAHVVEVKEATYAVATHVGSYEGLNSAWSEFYGKWFPASEHELGEGAPFELYVNNMNEVPVEELRTELWIPVR
jgi:AraC family transcriptional regulator